MIRRKLTLKRVDPWSVLKFGFVVNLALLFVALLGFWILWIVIGRLGLVESFCDSVGSIVLDLQECSLNGGNMFRTLLFLGLLGVVVQTGIFVFGAFLYNLISDLTGGLTFTFLDESPDQSFSATRTATERRAPATPSQALGPAETTPRTTPSSSDHGWSSSVTSARSTPREESPGPAAAPTPPPRSAERAPEPTSPTEVTRPSSSGSLWSDPTRPGE